ncbi:MAG TPA: peroxiredoxin family protein [Gammaproteobacteria bacterium]|nr:peroxiredoxin family protein [Gammaproteobacteria bacterium]
MRRSIFALVGAVVLSAGVVSAAELGPQVGAKFPHDLAAPDQAGKPQTLQSVMGGTGVAIFFVRSADWCPFCMGQLVDANRHLARFRALGLNVVSVSVDEVEKIAAFAAAQKIEYPMLADPTGAINLSLGIRDEQYPVGSAQFGVPRPTLYVVDRSGTIRLRYMEPTYRTRPNLEAVLRDAAALGL